MRHRLGVLAFFVVLLPVVSCAKQQAAKPVSTKPIVAEKLDPTKRPEWMTQRDKEFEALQRDIEERLRRSQVDAEKRQRPARDPHGWERLGMSGLVYIYPPGDRRLLDDDDDKPAQGKPAPKQQ